MNWNNAKFKEIKIGDEYTFYFDASNQFFLGNSYH